MLRRHPDGWSVWRQALFALVPVLLGAAVMLAGDGPAPAPGFTRIETAAAVPAPEQATLAVEPAAATADVAPATPAATADSVTPAPAGEARNTAAPVAVAGQALPPPSAAPAQDATTGPVPMPAPGAAPASTTVTTTPTTTIPTTAPAPATTTTAAPTRTGRSPDASSAAEVVPLTNADRTAAGLTALSRNACLDSAASGFAEQMARSGVLAHNPGAGAGVTGCRADATWGDNVGSAVPCDVPRLEREWMASPGHRRNILTAAFTQVGVGAWTGDDGTCWVQVLFSS